MQQDQWAAFIQSHLYKDLNGFYELPYLSNGPETMVKSVADIPVAQHLVSEQAIYSDDLFTKGVMRYRKIEDGLWLLATDIEIRKNIISAAHYAQDLPNEYYFLSFAVFEYYYPVNNTFTEFAKLISTTCTFYRPGTEVTTYFYKNTRGRFFNILFTKEWVKKNISFANNAEAAAVDSFLTADTGFINWIDIVPEAAALSDKIYSKLEVEKDGVFDTSFLKAELYRIITDFFKNAFAEKRITNYAPLRSPDYANVAAAEKYIINNLHEPFIGIENLGKKVNLSSTKLKAIFKTVFGFSMLQYHKEKNMLLAKQLVQRSEMHIKNIALVTGYESAGKFTATFKKRFGVLPSSLRYN